MVKVVVEIYSIEALANFLCKKKRCEKNGIEFNNVYSIVDEHLFFFINSMNMDEDKLYNILRIININTSTHNFDEILDPDEKMLGNITLKSLQEDFDKKYQTCTINKFLEYLEEKKSSRDDRIFEDMIFLVSNFIEIRPRCTFDQLIEYLKQFNGEQKIKFIENFGIYNLEIHKIDE